MAESSAVISIRKEAPQSVSSLTLTLTFTGSESVVRETLMGHMRDDFGCRGMNIFYVFLVYEIGPKVSCNLVMCSPTELTPSPHISF